jgi:hypothetical protein
MIAIPKTTITQTENTCLVEAWDGYRLTVRRQTGFPWQFIEQDSTTPFKAYHFDLRRQVLKQLG